jgi:hypothetical protein
MKMDSELENLREQSDWRGDSAQGDAQLERALENFRLSVDAWSNAELNRPRTMAMTVRQRSWRLAAGWAMGCVLFVGGASGALYARHEHRLEIARIAAQRQAERAAEQARQVAALKASEDEDLLSKVDSAVSQEVPAAMEPLAQLMADDGKQ